MMAIFHARRVLACVAFATALSASVAGAQTIDAAFKADIEKLLAITGSAQLGRQAASMASAQILEGMKVWMPDMPQRVIEIVQGVLDEQFAEAFAAPDGIMADIVSIYARHFSPEDVRALIAFYSTDVGRRTISVMPVVMEESGAAGQQWTNRRLPGMLAAIEQRLREEGFLK